MTILEVISFIVTLCIGVLCIFLERHTKRMADLFTERHLAYEAEKGKNYATKEDIEGITKQIETVKNEVSFATQRKKDYIVERKRHLFNLLYYAEKISNGQNSLQLYARSPSEYKALYSLIDRTNDTILEMTHEFHILFAEYEGFEKEKIISNLVDNCSLLVVEIVTVAHNAAIAIKQSQNCFEEAEKNPMVGEHYMQQALELKSKAISLVKEPLTHKEPVADAINEYVVWLKDLFGQGLNFEYNLAKPQFEAEE